MRRFFPPIPIHVFCCGCLMSLLVGASGPARAQDERGGQFVFVIDDSGSMSQEVGGLPAADPDRLAVFAVRSLIAMLDDSDEVAVVRLNGPLEGEVPSPLVPLGRGRRRIEEMLGLDSALARYEGQRTPCRSALDTAGRLLEAAFRPGVAQVMVVLTDGDCNGGAVDPKGFLGPLRSFREGLFQLYLLRFRGRPFEPALVELATASGGQAIEVGSEDPTALLEPFADALTRSQGYEAEVLAPGRTRMAAHLGARRVRLLAVARGEGEPLGFEIGDHQGRAPAGAEKPPARGFHRWPGGETFRYAALDYRPGAGETEVRVTGGGDGWKVVAVPDYRLFVRLEVWQGPCDAREVRRDHSIEAGQILCAVMSVVDEAGRLVAGELATRGLDARIRIARQEPGADPPLELLANQVGDRAEFFFEQPHLEEGVWILQPRVRLSLASSHDARPLPARVRTLQAATVRVEVSPREIDLGHLVPGAGSTGDLLRFEGNFPATKGRLEVLDRAAVPPCIHFRLGDAAEGETTQVRQQQGFVLGVRADPYCGPTSFERRYSVALRVVLDQVSGQVLPSPTFTAGLALSYEIEFPGERAVRLTAGESRGLDIPLASNAIVAQGFEMTLLGPAPGERWPAEGLVVAAAAPGGVRLDPASGAGAVFRLEISSSACCSAGSFENRLELRPVVSDAAEGPTVAGVGPIVIPLRIEVEGQGLWACRGPWIRRGLLWLALLLLLLYLVSMVRHSSFLSRQHLAASLVPLRWDPYGAAERDQRPQEEMLAMVRAGMGLAARAVAWLRANPLVFGLPGKRYRETVELMLEPERRVDRSRLHLVAGREHLERLQKRPAPGAGRLFARATGGRQHVFYSVPKNGLRIGRLVPEHLVDKVIYGDPEDSGASGDGSSRKAKVVRHKKRQRLVHPIVDKEREEGRAAGWQLG